MNLLGLIFAIAASITWGLVYTVDQKVLTNLSPLAFLFFSSLISVIVVLPIILYLEPASFKIINLGNKGLPLILLAVGLAALANFFIFSAIKILGSSTASVFEISYPFFVVIFGLIIFGGAVNLWFILGSILMFTGAVVIILWG